MHVCRGRLADTWSRGFAELVTGLHTGWWDLWIVLGLEGSVGWGGTGGEDFGFEFWDFVVADEDAGCMLCAS